MASGPPRCARCSRTSTRSCATPASSRARSTPSSSARARAASRARGSASRSRAGWRSHSISSSPASRRWTRWPPRGWTPIRGGRSARRGVRPGPARTLPGRARARAGDRVRRERGDPLPAALERQGALVLPDEDDVHRPSARLHAALAVRFGLRRRSSRSTCARPTRRRGARVNVELRRLEQRDLDIVEEIERAPRTTPWSRSMFAAESASRARSRSARTS